MEWSIKSTVLIAAKEYYIIITIYIAIIAIRLQCGIRYLVCLYSTRTCNLGVDTLVWNGGDCGVCVVGKM